MRRKRLTKPDEPSQATAKGLEIPVPTRGDVLRDLAKVAVPGAKAPSGQGKSRPQQ